MPRVLRSKWALDFAAALLVFGLAFAAYASTLTPGLSYASPDGGEMATIPYRLGLLHPSGYPLYTWLAKLFTFVPVGNVAYRINLLSAVGAAGSAAAVYGLGRILTGSIVAAAFGAALWSMSTTLWSQAVIAEVYAPNAFMLALVLLLAVAWGVRARHQGWGLASDRTGLLLFYCLCLAFALSLGTHLSNLAFAPALAVYVLAVNWRVLAVPRIAVGGGLCLALGLMQFLWLPYRADGVNDPLILGATPASPDRFLDYTVNAFSRLRWAFPLDALPERLRMYAGLVKANFGAGGALLAIIGALELARLRHREFLLLAAGYAIEVVFFLEYRVFDIDVFFIPAHMVLGICAAFGAWRLLVLARWLMGSTHSRTFVAIGSAAMALVLFLPLVSVYGRSRDANDRSADTVIHDFYHAVFARLPQGSTLVGLTGVIGADMFYFRLVEDRRPDVDMPLLRDPRRTQIAPGTALFTTWRPQQGRQIPWAPSPRLFPANAWFVPVLAGPSTSAGGLWFRRSLTLYEVSSSPPADMVVTNPQPRLRLDAGLLDVRLVGCDLPEGDVKRGGLVRLRLYWAFTQAGSYTVTTQLGDSKFSETHTMTFGNLPRYLQEIGTPPRQPWATVEQYDLVVPSSQPLGPQPLKVTVTKYGAGGERTSASVEAGTITVTR